MKPIEPNSIFLALIIIGLFFAGLFCIGYALVKWQRKRNKQEDEYEITYAWLSGLIENKEVNSDNYEYLFSELKKLYQLKWKNKEKTTLLFSKFLYKFKDEATKRVKNKV